jgi:1-acyl-sn-glycerol-3-phosphate acyltransferase
LPVALQFIDTASGARSLSPCYVGDDTLLGSVWRTLAGPPITAVVRFGVPQRAAGRERRAWAGELRCAVQELRSD